MIIEIKKKQLIIAGVLVSLILFLGNEYALYSLGYSHGYSSGYSEGHTSGVAEIEKKYQNPKGDGSFWYAEAINNDKDYIYHSTSACPNIRNGINENWGFTNATYRKQHSQFCSKCMDSNLIRMCQAYLYTDKDWK